MAVSENTVYMGQARRRAKARYRPKTHPAWTGQHRIVDSGGQVARFNKRFAGLGVNNARLKQKSQSRHFAGFFICICHHLNQQIC